MSGRRTRGFTLIELLVATVIFMIFVGAVYGAFAAAQQAMTSAEEQEDLYQTGRVLLAQLGAAVSSAYQPAETQESTLTGEDTEAGAEELQEDILTLQTTAHVPTGAARGGVCQVTYLMGEETEDERAGLYCEVIGHPGLELDEETPERRLLSPLVVGFNCRYLPAGDDWETEWIGQTTLPVAVRLELTLRAKRRDAKPVVLMTTVNVMMATTPATGESNAP